MANELKGKKIAFLVAEMFEEVELTKPWKALEDAGAEPCGKLAGMIARAPVDDQDLVAEALQGFDAAGDVPLFVLRDDGCGKPRHVRGSVFRRAIRSVLEWSLGSPATRVRPPKLATSSRSGTVCGV